MLDMYSPARFWGSLALGVLMIVIMGYLIGCEINPRDPWEALTATERAKWQ